jgi:DeoC/LacD family aldolase
MLEQIVSLHGSEAEALLRHACRTIPKERLHLSGPDYLERVHADSDRNARVMRSLTATFNHRRLAGTGYLTLQPVDQGVEHSAGASFAPNAEVHLSADLTGQAKQLGATRGADIKPKQGENNGGYTVLNFGKTHKKVYSELTSDHLVDLTRYQVANCYPGRAGMINSGGASGTNNLAQAVHTAVISKRAGGMGMISGRKAFQKPVKDGVAPLECHSGCVSGKGRDGSAIITRLFQPERSKACKSRSRSPCATFRIPTRWKPAFAKRSTSSIVSTNVS